MVGKLRGQRENLGESVNRLRTRAARMPMDRDLFGSTVYKAGGGLFLKNQNSHKMGDKMFVLILWYMDVMKGWATTCLCKNQNCHIERKQTHNMPKNFSSERKV